MRVEKMVVVASLAMSLSTANAALHDRGAGLVYDDVLRVTWLQDANYIKTSGQDKDGRATFQEAIDIAAKFEYFDSARNITWTDWRLPTLSPLNGQDFQYVQGQYSWAGAIDESGNVRSPKNELGWMFSENLGLRAYRNADGTFNNSYGVTASTIVSSSGVQIYGLNRGVYWDGIQYDRLPTYGWAFNMESGGAGSFLKTDSAYVWLVHDGDVAAVPEPETGFSALIGLFAIYSIARRGRQQSSQ